MQPGAGESQTKAAIDWSSAASSAAELPIDQVASIGYWESRLAAREDQLDCLLAIHRTAALRACERTAAHLDRESSEAETWRHVANLFDKWADGRSLISARVPTVWLEFDDVGAAPRPSAPSVSVCITPSYRATDLYLPHDEHDLHLAREALSLLGVPRNGGQDDLARVFTGLPSEARWIHVSCMLGRTPRAVKLYGVLARRGLLDYLERVGWAGDRDAIEGALEHLYPADLLGDQLFLDLNLNDFRDPARCSLGLAVSQQHLRFGLDRDPTRARLLDRWTEAGLCDPDKMASVAAWPERAPVLSAPQFQREMHFLDLKLVWRAGAGLSAKAYRGRQRFRGLFSP